MQVEAKACKIGSHANPNNLSCVNMNIICISNNFYKLNYSLLLGHIFESGSYMVRKNVAK